MEKVEVRALARLAIIHALLTTERDTRNYRRGFLAGFFDAEGQSGDVLRISQVDVRVLERVQRYAASLGFTFQLELRPTSEHAATRWPPRRPTTLFLDLPPRDRAEDRRALRLRDECRSRDGRGVGAGPTTDVVDIQTSTGTFFAAGLATHNCYARPSHEYLGFSAGLDFERRIMVKDDAPELLRRAPSAPRWEPQVVALSGNTDCYQPVERRLRITRRCLEVFAEFRNPVSAITTSALVARDVDLFAELARHGAAHVLFSVTSLDSELARRMEPRAARPERRLEAMATLARAGVPVGVMIGPVIPGLNDAEIPRILAAAARAGAQSGSWVLLRLAKPIDELFDRWLADHYPERRERVLGRIRDTRGGRISDSRFGIRQRGQGEYAEQIAALFAVAARKHGLDRRLPPLETAAFRRPPKSGDQLNLL
jgi:DNA repair photolyase